MPWPGDASVIPANSKNWGAGKMVKVNHCLARAVLPEGLVVIYDWGRLNKFIRKQRVKNLKNLVKMIYMPPSSNYLCAIQEQVKSLGPNPAVLMEQNFCLK